MLRVFKKKAKSNKIWWLDLPDDDGGLFFSFDKKTVYALFGDYPDKLSDEERRIFEQEEPYWAEFFKL